MFNFNTLYDSFVCTIDNVFIIAPKKQIIKKFVKLCFHSSYTQCKPLFNLDEIFHRKLSIPINAI